MVHLGSLETIIFMNMFPLGNRRVKGLATANCICFPVQIQFHLLVVCLVLNDRQS